MNLNSSNDFLSNSCSYFDNINNFTWDATPHEHYEEQNTPGRAVQGTTSVEQDTIIVEQDTISVEQGTVEQGTVEQGTVEQDTSNNSILNQERLPYIPISFKKNDKDTWSKLKINLNIQGKGFQKDIILNRIKMIKHEYFRKNRSENALSFSTQEELTNFRERLLKPIKGSSKNLNQRTTFEDAVIKLLITTKKCCGVIAKEFEGLNYCEKASLKYKILCVQRAFFKNPQKSFTDEEFQPFIVNSEKIAELRKYIFENYKTGFDLNKVNDCINNQINIQKIDIQEVVHVDLTQVNQVSNVSLKPIKSIEKKESKKSSNGDKNNFMHFVDNNNGNINNNNTIADGDFLSDLYDYNAKDFDSNNIITNDTDYIDIEDCLNDWSDYNINDINNNGIQNPKTPIAFSRYEPIVFIRGCSLSYNYIVNIIKDLDIQAKGYQLDHYVSKIQHIRNHYLFYKINKSLEFSKSEEIASFREKILTPNKQKRVPLSECDDFEVNVLKIILTTQKTAIEIAGDLTENWMLKMFFKKEIDKVRKKYLKDPEPFEHEKFAPFIVKESLPNHYSYIKDVLQKNFRLKQADINL